MRGGLRRLSEAAAEYRAERGAAAAKRGGAVPSELSAGQTAEPVRRQAGEQPRAAAVRAAVGGKKGGNTGGGADEVRPGYEQTYTNPGGVYTNENSGGSEYTGGYTGGGYASAQEGGNFTHFVMQYIGGPTGSGEPYLRNDTYIIERDAASGKAYLWAGQARGRTGRRLGLRSVDRHITMPDEASQRRFEQLIEPQLYGDELTFWRENRDPWEKAR